MLKRRILVCAIICMIFGIVLGLNIYLHEVIRIIIFLGTVVALGVSIFLASKGIISSKNLILLIYAIVFIFSYEYAAFYKSSHFPKNIEFGEEYNIEAVIIEKTTSYIDIKTLPCDIQNDITIRIYGIESNDKNINVEPYKVGRFKLVLSECENYIKANGVCYLGKGYIYSIDDYNGDNLQKWIYNIRTSLAEKVETAFVNSPQTSAFINAIVLGDTSGLTDKMYSDYSRLGITHVISVSGLHFTIIVFSLFKLLTFFKIPFKLRITICIVFSIFYCILTGASPSSVRAAIMIIMLIIGNTVLYQRDVITALFGAALIIMFINPYSFYSVSFILSFGATFAIIVTPNIFGIDDFHGKSKKLVILNNILQPTFITLSISMFISSVLYSRFGTLSAITPIANLLLGVFFTLVMYISIFTVLIFAFVTPSFIVAFVSFVIEKIHDFISYLASINGICTVPSETFIIFLILLVIINLISIAILKKKKREKIVKISIYVFCIIFCIDLIVSKVSVLISDKFILSDAGNSAIIMNDGEIHYIVEDEKCLSSDFLISNRIIDFDSLVIANIKDYETASYVIDKFSNDCKFKEIYCTDEIKDFKNENVKNLVEFSSDAFSMFGNDCIYFKYGSQSENNSDYGIELLWLGGDAYKQKPFNYVKNLVLSESFFGKIQNIKAFPKEVEVIYVPKGVEPNKIFEYIERRHPNAEIKTIDRLVFE